VAHQFLRLAEVEEKCAVSRSFIYQQATEGKFPSPVKLGKRSVWLRTEIDAWVKAKVGKRPVGRPPTRKPADTVTAAPANALPSKSLPVAQVAVEAVAVPPDDLEPEYMHIEDDLNEGVLHFETWQDAVAYERGNLEEAKCEAKETLSIDQMWYDRREMPRYFAMVIYDCTIILSHTILLAANLRMRPRR
jgi:prophage regulatory protein